MSTSMDKYDLQEPDPKGHNISTPKKSRKEGSKLILHNPQTLDNGPLQIPSIDSTLQNASKCPVVNQMKDDIYSGEPLSRYKNTPMEQNSNIPHFPKEKTLS